MDKEHAAKAAVEIADALGETGDKALRQAPRERVERQLARMIEVMGEEWVQGILRHTLALVTHRTAVGAELLFRKEDGAARYPGAVFFAWARSRAAAAVGEGTPLTVAGEKLTPQLFFSTFCWRERKPRAPKPPPAPRRDKSHEQRAVQLFATKANCRAEQLSVVTALRDSVWYDWADPDTGNIGQCRLEKGQWAQAPIGSRPVVLAYTARVTAKRKPATGPARAWGQGVRRDRPAVEPEVFVRRGAR